jgi:hypothetical protein
MQSRARWTGGSYDQGREEDGERKMYRNKLTSNKERQYEGKNEREREKRPFVCCRLIFIGWCPDEKLFIYAGLLRLHGADPRCLLLWFTLTKVLL